jgi:hypothetical protein
MEDGTITRNIFGLSRKEAEQMSFKATEGNYNIMTPQEAKLIGKKTGKKLDEYTPGSAPATETTEVVKIRLVTPLDDGSKNDKSNGLQKGMVFGKRYTFEVESYTNKPPRNLSSIKWVLRYHSLKDNTWKEWEATAKGNRVIIESNDPELCGRFFNLKAYINSKESVEFLPTWHHNRFRFFDRSIVHEEIDQRAAQGWRIDQGGSSLCGMAALYYAMIKRDATAYKTLAKQLFRTGEHTIGSYIIKPHEKALAMYDVKPTDGGFKSMGMSGADWIVMATTRSKESMNSHFVYNGFEAGSVDMLKAVNWPGMLTRMCREIAGFGTATAHDLSINSINNKKRLLSARIHDYYSNSDLEELKAIDRSYNAGHTNLMMIDADMIKDSASYNSVVDIGNDSHWVVYEGGLQFFDEAGAVTSNLDDVRSVSFKIYTWGYDPVNLVDSNGKGPAGVYKLLSAKTGRKISVSSFKSNYYGYIEVY